jgi:hypothetical protein
MKGGQTTGSLVEFVDLFPNGADLCGLKTPHAVAGASLRPVLADPAARIKDAAFTLMTRSPKLFGQSVRTARWRFTRWSDGQTELYDHNADPRGAPRCLHAKRRCHNRTRRPDSKAATAHLKVMQRTLNRALAEIRRAFAPHLCGDQHLTVVVKHGIIVTLEQLQASECNYINHIGEGAALVRAGSHRTSACLPISSTWTRMGDTPADLKAAMDVVVHVEIAEKAGRTYPAVEGDDFRPFFRVLREAGYQGAISIEGSGTDIQAGPAFKEIAKQAAAAA